MKKSYGKPIVSFESFAFSSNIAGDCGAINGIQGDYINCIAYGTQSTPEGGCSFVNNGVIIFTQDACMQTPQEKNEHDLCYHVSTDATRMFMS